MAYTDSADVIQLPRRPRDPLLDPNEPQADFNEPPEPDVGEPEAQEGPDQELEESIQKLIRWSDPQMRNIAEELDPELLGRIGDRCRIEYEIDLNSRSDWMSKSADAMKLAMQVAEAKTHPWPKSANIIFPLMTNAAIEFNSRSYPAIVQNRNIVKGVVSGPDDGVPAQNPQTGQPMIDQRTGQPQWAIPPGDKRRRAEQIGQHMSWQLLDEQREWEEETDRLLIILPIVGCCFRKGYFAPHMGRNVSTLVRAEKLIVHYQTKSMELAPRISEELEYYPYEVEERIRSGQFLDYDYRALDGAKEDSQAPIEFVEQHRLWDLDEDGYEEPYIVTFHKMTGKVCRIVVGFERDGVKLDKDENGKPRVMRVEREHYYTKYDFIPNPDGFYGLGFGQLLLPINKTVNSTINMLIDAGNLQVSGGGFIGRGLSTHTGSLKLKLGEWKPINAPGGAIRDAIVPMQHAGPSETLFALLGTMIQAGKEIGALKDVLQGQTNMATMQPTTLLALIEQGLKVFTATLKRILRSFKREYERLYRLNSIFLEDQAGYQDGDVWKQITRRDYAMGTGVSPVADPSMVSDMQRLAHAQFLQGYQNDPLFNPIEVRRRILDAANTQQPDKLLVQQPPPNPQLIAQAAELEIKATESRVMNVNKMAQAVYYIAQADAKVGQQDVAWAEYNLGALKAAVDSFSQQQPGAGPSPGSNPKPLPSPAPEGGPGMAPAGGPAPGGPGPEGLPGGGPAPAEGGMAQPLQQGARQGKDGNWYLPDPDRPGKWLMIDMKAGGHG